ncbi:hypothetical protein, partial [Clostridium sp.]|uniref:hypothetical protein n=1 Tax=Clostridium sp. TaxID=1506 RepID=UPI00263404FA
KIIIEEFNYENLKMVQPYQYNRRTTINSRINAMKLFNRNVPNYDKSVFYASKNQSNKLKIKTFIGTVKRIIEKRI